MFKHKNILYPVISALVAVLISISVVYIFMLPKPVVQFDVDKTVQRFSMQLAQSSLSDVKQIMLTESFSDNLVKQSKKYAQEHQVIILLAPAVVSGAPDVTNDISEMIKGGLYD